jgi:hypothetical protein
LHVTVYQLAAHFVRIVEEKKFVTGRKNSVSRTAMRDSEYDPVKNEGEVTAI